MFVKQFKYPILKISELLVWGLLHLWLQFVAFMLSRIVTFIVKNLLHLWLVISYTYSWWLLHLWLVLPLWLMFITFMVVITFTGIAYIHTNKLAFSCITENSKDKCYCSLQVGWYFKVLPQSSLMDWFFRAFKGWIQLRR